MPENLYAKILSRYHAGRAVPRTWLEKCIAGVEVGSNPPRNSLAYHINNLRGGLTLSGALGHLTLGEQKSLWVLSDEIGFVADDIRAIAHERVTVSEWRTWCLWFGECLLMLHEIQESARHGTDPRFYFELRNCFVHEFDASLAPKQPCSIPIEEKYHPQVKELIEYTEKVLADDGSGVPPGFAKTLAKETKRYREYDEPAKAKSVAFGIMMRRYGRLEQCGWMWTLLGRDEWPTFKIATVANQAVPSSPYPRVELNPPAIIVRERRFDLTNDQARILHYLAMNPRLISGEELIALAKADGCEISKRPLELIRRAKDAHVRACVWTKIGAGGGMRIHTVEEWESKMLQLSQERKPMR